MSTTEPEVELIRQPATCDYCNEPFTAAYVPHPFRPGQILTGQKACPRCLAEHQENSRRQAAAIDAETAKVKHEAVWSRICPALYRTEAEGGLTDLSRLTTDQPKAQTVMARPFSSKGLVIRGGSGTGKTRSMWRLVRKFHDEGRRIAAFTAAGFERSCRDAAGNFTLTAWFEGLKATDVFFVDDIGKTPWSPATLSTFFDLVEHRTGAGLPIYLTTNLNGDTLVSVLKMGKDMGQPMIRRLREFCDTLVM